MNMENKITKVFVCEECAGVVQPCVLTMVAADKSDPVPDTCPQSGPAKWRPPNSETAESCQLPTTQDKTPAAPTHQGEICPNAKPVFECQLSKGNICNGDRSDCSTE